MIYYFIISRLVLVAYLIKYLKITSDQFDAENPHAFEFYAELYDWLEASKLLSEVITISGAAHFKKEEV